MPNTFFIFCVNPASILEYTNALRCAEHQGEPHSMLAKESVFVKMELGSNLEPFEYKKRPTL